MHLSSFQEAPGVPLLPSMPALVREGQASSLIKKIAEISLLLADLKDSPR